MRYPSRLALVLVLGLLAASCFGVSRYQSKKDNMWGRFGYEEIALDTNLYRVVYEGDYTQPAELVDRYALYRAAELTAEKGYDFFTVMEDKRNNNSMTSTSTGLPSTSIEHAVDPVSGKLVPVAVTTQDYSTATYNSHSVVKTVRMYKGTSSSDNAYNAHTLLRLMAPSINRSDDTTGY